MTAEQKAQSFREIVEEYVFVSIDVETIVNSHEREMQALKAELARVRGIAEKVCEFYGDKERWKLKHSEVCSISDVNLDYGNLARKCAKELKEGA